MRAAAGLLNIEINAESPALSNRGARRRGVKRSAQAALPHLVSSASIIAPHGVENQCESPVPVIGASIGDSGKVDDAELITREPRAYVMASWARRTFGIIVAYFSVYIDMLLSCRRMAWRQPVNAPALKCVADNVEISAARAGRSPAVARAVCKSTRIRNGIRWQYRRALYRLSRKHRGESCFLKL